MIAPWPVVIFCWLALVSISSPTPEAWVHAAGISFLRFEKPSQAVKLRPILPRCDQDGPHGTARL